MSQPIAKIRCVFYLVGINYLTIFVEITIKNMKGYSIFPRNFIVTDCIFIANLACNYE
jgi:hypothetical protein